MAADLDFLRHIADESSRFRAALTTAPPGAAVPTCPDWDAADLAWHLAEVQSFWGRVVQQRCTDPAELDDEDLTRPGRYDDLLELARRSAEELVTSLRDTPAGTHVWTWAEDQTAGFVLRRQAHEALIHRVDAECTVDDRTPLDPALAADGVDEALRIMFSGAPEGVEVVTDPFATLRVSTSDTGASWFVTLARYEGSDEEGGPESSLTLVVADSDPGLPTAATVNAAAGDLDCWLWGRPPLGSVELSGDVKVLAGLRQVVDAGIV
jgi:uncharacterized protein (TIGR03083 family)